MSKDAAVRTPAARPPAGGGRPEQPLYEPLDWGLVRAPLLPIESYPRGEGASAAILAGPNAEAVQSALAVGSPDLVAALSRAIHGDAAARRLQTKLRRYLIRMAARATPYGLFAGVGLVRWGQATDLRLGAGRPRTRSRVDMEWLTGMVDVLESQPAIRRRLRLLRNPAVLVRAGRVFVAAPVGPAPADSHPSVRCTEAVRRVLELARTPIAYDELAAALASVPDASEERVAKLIDELYAHGVLMTELRPPLTGADPARHVSGCLSGIPDAVEIVRGLDRLLTSLQQFDALPISARSLALPPVVDQARALHPTIPRGGPIQVDMALSLAGAGVHRAIASEAVAAAEVLLRLDPHPGGPPHIERYRRAFVDRYGEDRAVPVLELLDPRFGLGSALLKEAPEHLAGAAALARDQALQHLAVHAIRARRTAIELDDATLARLQTWPPETDAAPLSLDLAVSVAARSAAEVDAGDFRIVVGPNVGAPGAGRTAGRFADLLGPAARRSLALVARAETEQADESLFVEIVYAPEQARCANVAVRPGSRHHEIAIGAIPGVAWDRVVPLDEVAVHVRNGRFEVIWTTCGRRLIAVQGHMLSHEYAPALACFLLDVAADGRPQLGPFDWGSAAGFPFLPRVARGRAVLALARWQVPAEASLARAAGAADSFPPALLRWRADWQVPRWVQLAEFDNRLLLDLDDRAAAELLGDELARLPASASLVLEEAFPGPEETWLPGPNGRHAAELIVPIVRRVACAPAMSARVDGPAAAASPDGPRVAATGRLRTPGSEWLYLKLYCPAELQDDVLTGPLRSFAAFARSAALADSWFFVRYADPDPHLRLRFHGDPAVLLGRLLGPLCAWAGELVASGACLRFGIDTYERELERFGGEAGLSVAEAIFAADSEAAVELIGLERSTGGVLDRLAVMVASVDGLLGGFGLSEYERGAWYRDNATVSPADGREYRRRGPRLRALLVPAAPAAADPTAAALAAILGARTASIERTLAGDDHDASGPRAPLHLAATFMHLNLNRLAETGPANEELVLALLRRTREGLARAPLASR